jgi:hypothetical protein
MFLAKTVLCPYCGYAIDNADVVVRRGGSMPDKLTPEPGDVSICLSCGEPARFTDRCELRKMIPLEIAGLSAEQRIILTGIQYARSKVVPRGGLTKRERRH